jgi:hypothetical protein
MPMPALVFWMPMPSYGFEFVEIFKLEHFSALLATTSVIFPLCRQQRQSFFWAVVHNAEK